jgi:hypothetical protein
VLLALCTNHIVSNAAVHSRCRSWVRLGHRASWPPRRNLLRLRTPARRGPRRSATPGETCSQKPVATASGHAPKVRQVQRQKKGPPTRGALNPCRPQSEDDAAPEPRVPAEACAAHDRRRYDDGGGSHDYRGRHDRWSNDDSPIRPATSIRAAVKTDSASSFSPSTERRQG